MVTNIKPFALKHACNIRNRVRSTNRKTLEALFACTKKLSSANLDHFHPFGCPIYVLDAILQGTVSKLPWWSPGSRVGMYLGHSPHHAGNVALVLSLTTGLVSPQCHVIFDNDFSTVENLRLGTFPTNWAELNINQGEYATDINFQLSQEWTTPYSLPDQSNDHNNISWLTNSLETTHTPR